MVEPINLNKARKARSKSASKDQAAVNRLAFGRTRSQKDAEQRAAEQARRVLDGAKREPPER